MTVRDYDACREALADLIAEHRELRDAIEQAVAAAESIEPSGSDDWRESGIAMRTTVIRTIRAALDSH